MQDKAYNTHLVQLWLDNNRENYIACGALDNKKLRTLMHSDGALIGWLASREYGKDSDKIKLNKDMLYLGAIRQTIKDNMAEFYA